MCVCEGAGQAATVIDLFAMYAGHLITTTHVGSTDKPLSLLNTRPFICLTATQDSTAPRSAASLGLQFGVLPEKGGHAGSGERTARHGQDSGGRGHAIAKPYYQELSQQKNLLQHRSYVFCLSALNLTH